MPVDSDENATPLTFITVVAFPVETASPVKLALVVTVPAFPLIDPAIVLVTVKSVVVSELLVMSPAAVTLNVAVPPDIAAAASITVVAGVAFHARTIPPNVDAPARASEDPVNAPPVMAPLALIVVAPAMAPVFVIPPAPRASEDPVNAAPVMAPLVFTTPAALIVI